MTTLEVLNVPVSKVHPNDWNPNRMNETVARATRESIQEHGFIDPILVRPHPSIKDEWEIIDGEHRKIEAEESGYTVVPVIAIKATDAQAKKLTIILNETRGEADPVDLGVLLATLAQDMSMDDLLKGLPYNKVDIDNLLALGSVDWDTFAGTVPESPAADDDKWAHLHLSLPPNVMPLWNQALERFFDGVELQHPDSPPVAGGLFLEALVADFLAAQ